MSKILVIEDEATVRANFVELLQEEGFQALGAGNGEQGVTLAQQYRPDLIVCDVMMPGLDGFGVLTALRQDIETAPIPFIFLTAKTDKADLRQGMNLGADDYLTKPVSRIELLKAVNIRLEKQATLNIHFEKKLDELRGNLARSLPHEFFAPLTVILMSSELLLEEASPEQSQVLGRIHKAAERLQRLIQNFLLYAELEIIVTDPEKIKALQSGRSETFRGIVVAVARQRARSGGREADLQIEMEEGGVRIGEERLEKLVEELVDNAFKYSQPGTPVVIKSQPSGEGRLTLSIENKGRGLSAEQISNVGAYMQFDRKFYEQQGSGLGLALTQRIAQLHGGELSIESVPGDYTIVRVTLPTA